MNLLYRDVMDVYNYQKIYDEETYSTKAGYVLAVSDIKCDMQPYSTEKMERDYGYRIETTKVVFTDIIDEIKEDSLIKYNGCFYKVQKIILWDKLLKHLEVALIENDSEVKILDE